MTKKKTPTKYSEGNTNTSESNRKNPDEDKKPHKNWVLTIYLPEDDPPVFEDQKVQWLAYGSEHCPDTGRHHWQTFVGFHNGLTLSALITYSLKVWKGHWHCEPMYGNIDQNIEYCSKESKLIKHGTFPAQGKRSDLLFWRDKIMKGEVHPEDILMENPELWFKYGRVFDQLHTKYLRTCVRKEMTTCDWLAGGTGTGKSHKAYENYSLETHYIWCKDNGWWDGYRGQHTVIINEFRPSDIEFSELLALIDKWPHMVKRRGKEPVPFVSKHIIITAPTTPQEMFGGRADNKDNVDQLLRRVKVTMMTTKY